MTRDNDKYNKIPPSLLKENELPDLSKQSMPEIPKPKLEPKKPKPGMHLLKVFYCHGCQSCLRMGDGDTMFQSEHILSVEDISEKFPELLN